MLVRPDGDAAICIGQTSHAWITGQLARAWRDVEPRAAVCLAAEQHDIGWSEWDLRPQLHPDTGLPRTFMEIDFATRMAIWEPAPHRLESMSLYAATLVSMHGTALHRSMPEAQAYVAGQEELQANWIGRIGADPAAVARNHGRILVWDALSLALCLRWDPFDTEGLHLERVEDETFTLSPWPFEPGALTVGCEGRRLEERFDDQRALQAALERAPVVMLEFSLLPA
jgi:hypothetical protein